MATIDPTTVACRDSVITGDVQIGACCAIHPKAVIQANKGPIIIGLVMQSSIVFLVRVPFLTQLNMTGTHNIIEERARIVNNSTKPMRIGSYNYFSVGCQIIGTKVCQDVLLVLNISNNKKIPAACRLVATTCSRSSQRWETMQLLATTATSVILSSFEQTCSVVIAFNFDRVCITRLCCDNR